MCSTLHCVSGQVCHLLHRWVDELCQQASYFAERIQQVQTLTEGQRAKVRCARVCMQHMA